MICTYCKSDKIVLIDGEYVCTSCGTVVGYELVAPIVKLTVSPRRENRIFVKLGEEKKEVVKKKYSEVVLYYIDKICTDLGINEVRYVSYELFRTLDKRVYQGKNPRVVAASIVYLAAERLGVHIIKQNIAKVVKVSKLTIRDTVSKFRKYVSNIK